MSSSPPPPPPPTYGTNDPLSGIFKTSSLSLRTRNHLSRVYRTLAGSTALASLGAYIHLNDLMPLIQGGLLSLVASIGSLLMLSFGYPFIRGDASRANIRTGLFGLFSFSYGLSLGPLLDSIVAISDESIISTALILTATIFISFSASAIFSQRRSFLFLGGILASICGILSILGLMNIFIGSPFLFNVDLYAGLLMFCGFLLVDTQMIIERIESSPEHQSHGDDGYQHDTIGDSLQLFMDAIAIFIRLAMIMAKNSAKRDDDNDKGSRRRKTHAHMRG